MDNKLKASDKAAVQSAIDAIKSAMSDNDTAGMNSAMEQLTQAQHKAAEALYKQAGSGAAGPGAPGGAGGGSAEESTGAGGAAPGGTGDVIDAEVVEEEKK